MSLMNMVIKMAKAKGMDVVQRNGGPGKVLEGATSAGGGKTGPANPRAATLARCPALVGPVSASRLPQTLPETRRLAPSHIGSASLARGRFPG